MNFIQNCLGADLYMDSTQLGMFDRFLTSLLKLVILVGALRLTASKISR